MPINGIHTPQVFIGSSSEALEIAHELQYSLNNSLKQEYLVTAWDQGAFGLMRGTFECIRTVADACDFAIVVLTADCVTTERGKQLNTPRDNVVFEAGFFVGTLGRERTIVVYCEEDNIDLPTDLLGTTMAKYRRPADGNHQAALNAVVVPITRHIRSVGRRERPDSGRRVFIPSDGTEFVAHMEELLAQAKDVVLIGTGLNILQRDPLRYGLMSRAAQGKCRLEVYLADPASPAVRLRLVEEELGQIRPPVGREGLQTRLVSLLAERRTLGDPASITIRLFRHYPTQALLIADTEYYIYPYGYATLGNFSPVIHFSKNRPLDKDVILFLDKQYKMVKNASVEAAQALQLRSHPRRSKGELLACAVYFVPSEESDLYRFGSATLGYDVRREKPLATPWEAEVGEASAFGFHLTCADALYFFNEADIAWVVEEMRFLAAELAPFELCDLRVQGGAPDPSSISIVLGDPSGSLEALHCELVHCVYRWAVASNYSLKAARCAREQNSRRSELMIRRYQAPYILGSYRPHFTLLTNVAPAVRDERVQQLETEFRRNVSERRVLVERLAVMRCREPEGPWRIVEEIKLGR